MKKITLVFVIVLAVLSFVYNGIYEHENRKLWHYYNVTESVLDSLDVKYDIADELPGYYYDIMDELK